MRIVPWHAAAALALISSLAAALPASAQLQQPWGPRAFCTLGGKNTGTELPNCYYYTWDQCMATARGNGQSCTANPFYSGATNGLGTAPRRRTHRKSK